MSVKASIKTLCEWRQRERAGEDEELEELKRRTAS